MAARSYVVTSGSIALAAATVKTLLELTASANNEITIIEFDLTFDGTTVTATPVTVDLVRYATTGTGTATTPLKWRNEESVTTPVTTAKKNFTVEAGTPVVQRQWLIPPTSGITLQFPLGREPTAPASGLIALRVNAPAIVNCIANIVFEE